MTASGPCPIMTGQKQGFSSAFLGADAAGVDLLAARLNDMHSSQHQMGRDAPTMSIASSGAGFGPPSMIHLTLHTMFALPDHNMAGNVLMAYGHQVKQRVNNRDYFKYDASGYSAYTRP